MTEMKPEYEFEQHWADYAPHTAEILKNWSPALYRLQENSLRHWAVANQIDEAYRIISHSSGDAVITMNRYWHHGSNIYYYETINIDETSLEYRLIRKLSGLGDKPRKIFDDKWREAPLNSHRWLRFQKVMAVHFWDAAAWQNKRVVLVPSPFLFEGYRQGAYAVYETNGAAARKGIIVARRLLNRLVKVRHDGHETGVPLQNVGGVYLHCSDSQSRRKR